MLTEVHTGTADQQRHDNGSAQLSDQGVQRWYLARTVIRHMHAVACTQGATCQVAYQILLNIDKATWHLVVMQTSEYGMLHCQAQTCLIVF